MNFLADESVDQQIVRRLREDGHHVWYVAEMDPGLADIAVLERADREAALLLTAEWGDSVRMSKSQERFSLHRSLKAVRTAEWRETCSTGDLEQAGQSRSVWE